MVEPFFKAFDANFIATLCWNVIGHDFLSTLLLNINLRFCYLKADLIKLHGHSLVAPKPYIKIKHSNYLHIVLESYLLRLLHPFIYDVGLTTALEKNQKLDFEDLLLCGPLC